MNKEEAAEYIGVSPRKLHELSVELNIIPYHKLEKEKRNSPVWYYEYDLDEFMESTRIAG